MSVRVYVSRVTGVQIRRVGLILRTAQRAIVDGCTPKRSSLCVQALRLKRIRRDSFCDRIVRSSLSDVIQSVQRTRHGSGAATSPRPALSSMGRGFRRTVKRNDSARVLVRRFYSGLRVPFRGVSSRSFSTFLQVLDLSGRLGDPGGVEKGTDPVPPGHGTEHGQGWGFRVQGQRGDRPPVS